MYTHHNLLLLNVGFIVHQTVGYSRDFPFDIPRLSLPPDLDLTNFSGTARVTRTAQGLLVQLKMRAWVKAECVRCLEEFAQLLEVDSTDLFAFSPEAVTDSGLLLPESNKIDLAPILREEMLLAIPIKPVCKADCKGLCPICGENLNQVNCEHSLDKT